jgi:hypothetical protein
MINVQKSEFAARMARIEAGTGSYRTTIYVGNEETVRPEHFARTMKKKSVRVTTEVKADQDGDQRPLAAILAMPLAFLIGCAAMVLWRMADFHFPGLQSNFANPDQTLAVTAATSMVLAILLCQTVSLTAPQHVLAAFLGVIAMALGFHNLVHVAPDQFAKLFSPAWVTEVLGATKPMSLVWHGVTYAFG